MHTFGGMGKSKIAFPQHHRVELDGAGKLSSGPRPSVPGGLPEQFGGRAEDWNPESLLAGAVALDFLTTLRSLAHEAELPIHGFRCTGDVTLAKTDGKVAVQVVLLEVALSVATADGERAKLLARRAKEFCVVANALKFPVEVAVTVHAGEIAPSLGTAAKATPQWAG